VILVPPAAFKTIVDDAEAAYPNECCGLLIGRSPAAATVLVTDVRSSRNLDPGRGDRFEIDPQVRFDVMRSLEGGPDRIVGHYHSHPGLPAQPSARDLEMAWEPDLVWLITSVMDGQAVHTTAHVVDSEGRQFREIGLRTTDWGPYAGTAPNTDRDDGTGR